MTDLRECLADALRTAHYRILGGSTDCRIDPGETLADVLLSLPGITIHSSSSAIGSAGDDRPSRSAPNQGVEREGSPTTIAAALRQLDELRDFTTRELARLNSELSQAIAQRDIARNQRDDARAQLFGITP